MDRGINGASISEVSDVLAKAIIADWDEPLLVLDRDLCITFANEYFCRWIQASWKEIHHQPLEAFLSGDELLGSLRAASEKSGAHDLHAECRILRVGIRSVHITVKPLTALSDRSILLRIEDSSTRELFTGALDTSSESAKRDEVFQRSQSSLLRSIMESSGDGILIVDAEGQCLEWNLACERILGSKPHTVPHDKWPETFGLYLPDKVTLFDAEDLPLMRTLRGESSDEVEVWVRNKVRPGGVWISVSARPLMRDRGGAVVSFRDVTFAKDAAGVLAMRSEEVARSNRELEQFAYVASHDLQEPLRMVSSYVQLLARRYRGKLDTDADQFIEYATDGAKRMSQLIDDLLGYSRIGRGGSLNVAVDCEAVLERVICNLEMKIKSSAAQISHDPLPCIQANEQQLVQLFQNLIDNALKFRSAEIPRIHISAQRRDDKWLFSVSDNGIGIASEYRDRVFVIFQRLHNREAYPGTGIGLAVCKKIVEQHFGLIWLEPSTDPSTDHGTTVRFSWPDYKITTHGKETQCLIQ